MSIFENSRDEIYELAYYTIPGSNGLPVHKKVKTGDFVPAHRVRPHGPALHEAAFHLRAFGGPGLCFRHGQPA